MKKYLFIFTTLATLATIACDTSSKASTTQTLAPAPTTVAEPTAQTTNQPTVISDTSMMARKKGQFQKAKSDMMQEPKPSVMKKTDN